MKFKFDPNQEYQLQAITAIVDIFDGQPRLPLNLKFDLGGIPSVPNELGLSDEEMLANVQEIQRKNAVYQDDELHYLEETIKTPDGADTIRFHNFSIEMETGTGKTYVYIRTALELFERYGFRKFIIVVPSVAIREGVMKTFEMTREHFSDILDNIPYRYYEYDSDNLTQVRQFALSDSVEFMVMTLASFNKADINVIFRSTDRLQGETPIHLVQAARPILILDEPQNMESEKSIAALAALRPLFALRYSATHRHPYNLMYRLTPAQAYRLGLVKRIEVASVAREDETNRPYIRVNWIKTSKRTLKASITLHKLYATGEIKEATVYCRPGDSLQEKSGGRPLYAGFDIDELNADWGFVRFANTKKVNVGEEYGADKSEVFEAQIYTTIEEHIRKQSLLAEFGIKVLSLFFVDRVDNYAQEDGIIRRLFNKAFDQFKSRWPEWKDLNPDDVQAAYFAQRTTRDGEVILEDSVTGTAQRDVEAYELIMQDKERLLSFDEKTAFIFSHSALREGWDNPNVFQICTLNQSVSETRKRQEIGRGVRLCVNQEGDRLHDERINVLTVVANESYEHFVNAYQNEILEEYQTEIEKRYGRPLADLTPIERAAVEKEYQILLPPRPGNARKRVTTRIVTTKQGHQLELADGKVYTLSPEFHELWKRISRKTRYHVRIDTPRLIDDVTTALAHIDIPRPRVSVTKARVDLDLAGVFRAWQMSAARTLVSLDGRFPLPNLLDIMSNLMEQTSPPMRVTRKTLLEIMRSIPEEKATAMIENPHEFAVRTVRLIKDELSEQMVRHIRYEKIDEWYGAALFEPHMESWEQYVVPAQRSLYDHITVDSNVEREFVESLEKREDISLYIKLPAWFVVPTPIGNYNPDWAIVMDNAKGEQKRLYLVSETKGVTDLTRLPHRNEQRKVICGRRHFKDALGVRYEVVTSPAELPEIGIGSFDSA